MNLDDVVRRLESDSSRDRMLALASLRDVPAQEALPLIKKVLHDTNGPIRSMAVFSLGIKPTEESFLILTGLLAHDPDYGIRADAAGALGYLEDPRGFEPLHRAFYEDTEWLVRFSAIVALGNLKDARAYDALVQVIDNENEEVMMHQAAIAALGEIGMVDAVDKILTFANAGDWLVRQRLAEALGNLPTLKSQAALQYLVKDPHPNVAEAAAIALQHYMDGSEG